MKPAIRLFHLVPRFMACLVLISSPSAYGDDKKPTGKEDAGGAIREITWETKGGGQVKFRVVPDGDSAFTVHVAEHNFKKVGRELRMTADDGDAYRLARQIFDGTLNLGDETTKPKGATGSWTSITVVRAGGKSETIENIKAWGRLKPLGDFIDEKLGDE